MNTINTMTAIEGYKMFLAELENTDTYSVVDTLCGAYIDGDKPFQTEREEDVSIVSATLDGKVEAGTVSYEDLGEYEEAARRAGFYAGFKAAVAYIHYLQKQTV